MFILTHNFYANSSVRMNKPDTFSYNLDLIVMHKSSRMLLEAKRGESTKEKG